MTFVRYVRVLKSAARDRYGAVATYLAARDPTSDGSQSTHKVWTSALSLSCSMRPAVERAYLVAPPV